MNNFKYIIISILFVPILIHCKKENVANPGYAIGVIYGYDSHNYFPYWEGAQINYTFIVNGKQYDNQYSNRQGGKEWKIPASGNYKQGDQYMVQYNEFNPGANPQSSRMLFSYPVKDSSDYKRYITIFATNPPN